MKTQRLFQPDCVGEIGNLVWGTKGKRIVCFPKVWTAVCYVLHRCHLARFTSDSEWCPIYSQILVKIAGSGAQWKAAKLLLIANGWLECDGMAKIGLKSLCFRLGHRLRAATWKLSPSPFELPHAPTDGLWRVEIDADQANGILESIAPERGWEPERVEAWKWRVENFSSDYTVGRTGRQFGDANMVPSEVRDALTIGGERTVEIDIANSQPLFLATLYPSHCEEKQRYVQLVESGQVYEYFAAKLGTDRKGAKAAFAPWLFGQTNPTFGALFAAEFPELAAIISAMRSKHYKALVYDLQRKEADVVLSTCEEFGAVSIHDGIRVRASLADKARQHLAANIARLGLKATLV